MNNLRMTVKDDSGEECPIENIRTFQKHLQLFHKIRSNHPWRERALFHGGQLLPSEDRYNGEGTIWIMDFLDRM